MLWRDQRQNRFMPAGRPVLGLAVMLEPFHIANALSLRPAGRTPVTVADSAEIEVLVTITETRPSQLRWRRVPPPVGVRGPAPTADTTQMHGLTPTPASPPATPRRACSTESVIR